MRNRIRIIPSVIATLFGVYFMSPGNLLAQTDLLPMQPGTLIGTCYSGSLVTIGTPNSSGYVVALFNVSDSELAAAGTGTASGVYPYQNFHNEQAVQNPNPPDPTMEWRNGNLGEVFGITIDEASPPNIYVSSTTCYGKYGAITWPAGEGPGSVYKLDGATGDIIPFAQLPNDPALEPSLGQICHHEDGGGADWIYVSNFEDGLIYRLDAAGATASTFDHGVDGRPQEALAALPDTGTAGYTQHGRRVWGLEDFEGRLYYGIWNTSGTAHEIWSVALDGSGDFVPNSAMLEFAVPLNTGGQTAPISDITFSKDGSMFLAERYHSNWDAGPSSGSHACRILEYTGGSGLWAPHPSNLYKPGWLTHVPLPNNKQYDNSAGGVAVECEGNLWTSVDAGHYPAPYVYGAQHFPVGGNGAEYATWCDATATNDIVFNVNCHLVDYDGDTGASDKTRLGDVEVFDPNCDCMDIDVADIVCPEPNQDFTLDLTIGNASGQDAAFILFLPCPEGDLPEGAETFQPGPAGLKAIPGGLADGASAPFIANLPATLGGKRICFLVTLLNPTLGECCTEKVCVDLPDCACYEVLDYTIEKSINAQGEIKWIFTTTIHNNSPFTLEHATFSDLRFDPNPAPIVPPIPPGATGTIYACITNAAPAEVLCFYMGVHTSNLVECCSQKIQIQLPDCLDEPKPDECFLLPPVAMCCPDPVGIPTANFILRICNGSPTASTYSWNLNAFPPGPECAGSIPLANYSPNLGSVNVPANSCVDIPITVTCDGLLPEDCACYEICIREQGNPNNTFCCKGFIHGNDPGAVKFVDDPAQLGDNNPAVVLAGGIGRMAFLAENNGQSPVVGTLVIQDADGISNIRMGATEGTVIEVPINIPARGSVPVAFDIIPRFLNYGDNRPRMVTVYLYSEVPGRAIALMGPIYVLQPPSNLVIADVQNNGDGQLVVAFMAAQGEQYRIQRCQEFGAAGGWEDHACALEQGAPADVEIMEGAGEEIVCFIDINPDAPRMLFRLVKVEPTGS